MQLSLHNTCGPTHVDAGRRRFSHSGCRQAVDRHLAPSTASLPAASPLVTAHTTTADVTGLLFAHITLGLRQGPTWGPAVLTLRAEGSGCKGDWCLHGVRAASCRMPCWGGTTGSVAGLVGFDVGVRGAANSTCMYAHLRLAPGSVQSLP